jgi:hypothetical protein
MLRAEAADEEKSQTDVIQAPPPEPVAAKGNTFGDYAVLKLISSGSTGTIYKAQRQSDGLIVSLKVLPKELAGSAEYAKRRPGFALGRRTSRFVLARLHAAPSAHRQAAV